MPPSTVGTSGGPRPSTLSFTWTNLTPTTNGTPPPRIDGGLVYDAHDGYMLLFGGSYDNPSCLCLVYYNDTWAYSNGTWTNLTATVAPSPRDGFGLAYDGADGYVVLFGGHPGHGPNALNDTWKFSDGAWTNITTHHSPPARYWGAMTYDPTIEAVLLFGGESTTYQYLGDTWEFAAGSWSSFASPSAPSARDGSGLTFDQAQNVAVLFGGQNATPLNDTWAFNGANWTRLAPLTSPDPRTLAGFTYDGAAGVGVLFGGYPASFTPYGTWIYDNGSWTDYNDLPNTPTFNFNSLAGQFAYDPATEWVMMVPSSTPVTYALNITASGAPALRVTAAVSPLSGAAPLSVELNSTATGGTAPYTFSWLAGDGAMFSTENASHVYSAPGTYTAQLWVNDSAGATFQQEWTVSVQAAGFQASASAAPDPANVGETVAFRSTASGGTAPYTISWKFGDGGTSTLADPTHTYLAAGTYPVAFEAQDATLGSIFENFTETVVTVPLSVVAGATPLVGVAPFQVEFTSVPSGGTAPYTYTWGFGYQSAGSTSENASYTYDFVGTYSANLTVKDSAGATVAKSWTITAEPPPLGVSISASTQAPSIGETVTFTAIPFGGSAPYTYAWSFGDQGTSTVQDPDHSYGSTGSYNVSLTIHDKVGNSASANLTVVVSGSVTSSGSSYPVWEIGAIVLVVVLVAVVLLVLVARRRKPQPPAAPTPPASPGAP